VARRSVHYEAAFESYLQGKGWPYMVVDEAKRSVFAGMDIKSFDFVVYSDSKSNLLVDVKGRKFLNNSNGNSKSGRKWENWVLQEDVESMLEWERIFGVDFVAVFVFAYWLQCPPRQAPFKEIHFFKNRFYAFTAISVAEYADWIRPRSQRWKTVSIPTAAFTRLSCDIAEFL